MCGANGMFIENLLTLEGLLLRSNTEYLSREYYLQLQTGIWLLHVKSFVMLNCSIYSYLGM